MTKWKCEECGGTFEDPVTNWGADPGGLLSPIDWFCPLCSSWEVVFLGTECEEAGYWEKKMLAS